MKKALLGIAGRCGLPLAQLILCASTATALQAEYLEVAVGETTPFVLDPSAGGPSEDPRALHFVDGWVSADLDFTAQALVDVDNRNKSFPFHLGGVDRAKKMRREILELVAKRVSPVEFDGQQKVEARNSAHWAFRVEPDGDHPAGEVVRARVSGTLWLDGDLYVYGSGSARYEARVTVRNRLQPEQGGASRYRVVAAHVVDSGEILHSYDYSLGFGLGVAVGDGVEVDGDLGIGRDFEFEHKAIRKESYPFSLPLLVQVGESYELDFTLFGEAENRGLAQLHRSIVRFGRFPLLEGSLLGAGEEPGPADPSHLLDAIQFFQLHLPNVSIGKSLSGKATFPFPALPGLFGGDIIDVDNDFELEPLGKVDNVPDIVDKLGLPLNVGDKMAGSAPQEAPTSPPSQAPGKGGGAWFQDLTITVHG